MLKLLQMFQVDAKYFGLLLIRSSDPTKLPKWPKSSIFTSVYYETSMYQEWFHSFEVSCK